MNNDHQNKVYRMLVEAQDCCREYLQKTPNGFLQEVQALITELDANIRKQWPPAPEVIAQAKDVARYGYRDYPSEWMDLSAALFNIAHELKNAAKLVRKQQRRLEKEKTGQ